LSATAQASTPGHTTRQQIERIRLLLPLVPLDHNGVSRIVPARTSCTDISIGSQDVYEFAFALVTPLGSEAGVVSARLGTGSTFGFVGNESLLGGLGVTDGRMKRERTPQLLLEELHRVSYDTCTRGTDYSPVLMIVEEGEHSS
jgi:hypothetical protein